MAEELLAPPPGFKPVTPAAEPPAGYKPVLDSGRVNSFPSDETIRTVLELGGMIVAPLTAPARALATQAARISPRLGPLAARMGAAGAGGAAGTAMIDPTNIERIGETAALGAAGEAAGAAVFKGVEKLAAPFASKVLPGAKEAADIVTAGGGTLPAGQVVRSNVVDFLENVSDKAIFGGAVTGAKKNAQDIITGNIQRFADEFAGAGGREDVGVAIQDAIEDGTQAFRTAAKSHYKVVDQLAGGATVDINEVRLLAQELKEQYAAGLKSAQPGATRVLDDILERNAPTLSFADAQVLRSDLLAIGRSTTDLIPGRAQAVAKQLAVKLDRAMEDAAANMGDEALEAWRTANRFWKDGAQTFNSKLIKSLAEKDPEAVFSAAVKNAKPGTVRRVRNIVGAENWKAVQGQFLQDMIAKNTSQEGLSGSGLLRSIKTFGDDTLREMFPEAGQRHNLTMLANSLRIAERNRDSGIGSMWIQSAQGGGILLGGSFLGPAGQAAVLVTPAMIGKMLTNNSVSRWLSIGFTAPAGSDAAASVGAKLAAYFAKEGLLGE